MKKANICSKTYNPSNGRLRERGGALSPSIALRP